MLNHEYKHTYIDIYVLCLILFSMAADICVTHSKSALPSSHVQRSPPIFKICAI